MTLAGCGARYTAPPAVQRPAPGSTLSSAEVALSYVGRWGEYRFNPGVSSFHRRFSYSPDGRQILVATRGQILRFDSATGRELGRLDLPDGEWPVFRHSHDGRRLAVGDDRGRVHLYDTATWQRVGSYRVLAAAKYVRRLRWTADDSRLLAYGDEIAAWDVGRRRPRWRLTPHWSSKLGRRLQRGGHRFAGSAVLPDGDHVAVLVGMRERIVRRPWGRGTSQWSEPTYYELRRYRARDLASAPARARPTDRWRVPVRGADELHVSTDGRWLASLGSHLMLFDLRRGRVVWTGRRYAQQRPPSRPLLAEARGVAFVPGLGRALLWSKRRLWAVDLRSGRIVWGKSRPWESHGRLRFLPSPTGAMIAVESWTGPGSLQLWDATSARERVRLHPAAPHPGRGTLAWDPAGRTLLIETDRLRVVRATDGASRVTAAPGHHAAVAALAFVPRHGRLVSGDARGHLWQWSLSPAAGRPLPQLCRRPVGQIGIVAGDRIAAVVGVDGPRPAVQLWNARSGAFLSSLHGWGLKTHRIRLLPDRAAAVFTSDRLGGRYVWSFSARRLLGQLPPLRDFPPERLVVVRGLVWPNLAIEADGRTAWAHQTWHDKRGVRRVDLQSGRSIDRLPPLAGGVRRIRLDPKGRWLLTESHRGRLEIWDARRRTHVTTLPPAAADLGRAAFGPDGLATIAARGRVHLWRLPSGQLRQTLATSRGESVTALAWSPDGCRLAVGTSRGVIHHWERSIRAAFGRRCAARRRASAPVPVPPAARPEPQQQPWIGTRWRLVHEDGPTNISLDACGLVGYPAPLARGGRWTLQGRRLEIHLSNLSGWQLHYYAVLGADGRPRRFSGVLTDERGRRGPFTAYLQPPARTR